MNMREIIDGDQRLIMLRALTEAPAASANENILKACLAHFGHQVGTDIVRAHIEYLAAHGLVRNEVIKAEHGNIWVVQLTAAGEDVAAGRATHVGVAKRGVD